VNSPAAKDQTPARFKARTEQLPYAFRFGFRLVLLTLFTYFWNASLALLAWLEVVPFKIWPSWNIPFEVEWEAGFEIELYAGYLAIACGIILPAIYCAARDNQGVLKRIILAIVLSAAVQGLFFIGYSALGWQAYIELM
jgi:hypothetical protein